MSYRHLLIALGAAVGAGLGAALFASPMAYADDLDNLLYPPAFGPIGSPTNVHNINGDPFFGYNQADNLYHVLDNGNVIGQFTDTHSGFGLPGQLVLFLPGFLDESDTISNSTYAGLADGATQNYAGLFIQGFSSNSEIMTSFSLNNPGIETQNYFSLFNSFQNLYTSDATGTSDIVTMFGQSYTLFDFPATAAAGADAVDANWATDLAASFDPGLLS